MSDDDVKLLIDTLTAAVAAGQQVSVPAERVLELHARLLVAKMEAAESARDALAQPEATACPHIRSSGTGGWATHWCALAEHPQPEAVAWPKVNGTARMFDNARALMVIMEREPTDDEMRAFDDAIKGWGTSPPAALAAKEASRD